MGAVLGGMLARNLGFKIPGGSEGFGLVDIILILVVIGIIYAVVKRFRGRTAMKTSAARTRRPPFSFPGRSTAVNNRFPYPDQGRIMRPPRVQ